MPAESMIDRFLAKREQAKQAGDPALAAEIDAHLAQLGYRPGSLASKMRAAARAEAEAVPADRGLTQRSK